MENISEKENYFQMDELAFASFQAIFKILYVVHSHYKQDCYPSEHDKNNCKALGIPYLIVSYPDKKEFIYDPR